MKLWIDDVRPAPEGYVWCKSVNAAILAIEYCEDTVRTCNHYVSWVYLNGTMERYENLMKQIRKFQIELIDIDHDAGDYAYDGGDYIRLLDWLEGTGRDYPIRIHSMNPVGVQNMRAIIERNGWEEV